MNFPKSTDTAPPDTDERRYTTLVSDILPLPTPRFRGRIGSTYADSEADAI